jgi:hypothetical protein
MLTRLSLSLSLLTLSCFAQRAVDPRQTYSRVICVVPLVGSGSSAADPKRPQYAPSPGAADPNGILAFYFEPSDDGKSAVVEFVGRDRNALRAVLADRTITLFEKGRATKTQIESALRKVRKDFDLDRFGVVMP